MKESDVVVVAMPQANAMIKNRPAIVLREMPPFGDPRPITDQLWRDLYQPGLWKDLWFLWEGKPLLLANKQFIKDEEMLKFFTFRRPMPDYWDGPSAPE